MLCARACEWLAAEGESKCINLIVAFWIWNGYMSLTTHCQMQTRGREMATARCQRPIDIGTRSTIKSQYRLPFHFASNFVFFSFQQNKCVKDNSRSHDRFCLIATKQQSAAAAATPAGRIESNEKRMKTEKIADTAKISKIKKRRGGKSVIKRYSHVTATTHWVSRRAAVARCRIGHSFGKYHNFH